MFTVAYCCYANEQYVSLNLKNHYNYADEIIVSYGPFQGYPQYREMMGLPAEDNTLEIIKDFIKTQDIENKIKLIIQEDGFKNFTDSRNIWLPYVNGDWFCSLDCDEFYYESQMKLAKEMMHLHLNENTNMIYCNRRSFALDRNHHYDNSWYAKIFLNMNEAAQNFINEKTQTLQAPQAAQFKNGLGIFPQNGFDLFNVVAYRNRSGMKWTENSIDSILVYDNSVPYFEDLSRVVYEPNIRYNHYAACGNPEEYFAKQLYYHVVRGAINSQEELENKITYYKEKIDVNPYALMVWFENNPGVYFRRFTEKHPAIFDGIDIMGEFEDRAEADEVVDLEYEARHLMHIQYAI